MLVQAQHVGVQMEICFPGGKTYYGARLYKTKCIRWVSGVIEEVVEFLVLKTLGPLTCMNYVRQKASYREEDSSAHHGRHGGASVGDGDEAVPVGAGKSG